MFKNFQFKLKKNYSKKKSELCGREPLLHFFFNWSIIVSYKYSKTVFFINTPTVTIRHFYSAFIFQNTYNYIKTLL